MCGFVGKLSYDDIDHGGVQKSNNHLICRGPDNKSENIRKLDNLNMHLIFNRLSILDLSDTANQPMVLENSGSTLMFNGEIYNHSILRNELISNGANFKTSHSDSEVVLNGLEIFGSNFLEKLNGQFAIFFINPKEKKIILARDRVGQKPLYYKFDKNNLSFSSNLHSILDLDNDYTLSKSSILQYLNYGVINSPKTLFKNFKKLKPAEILEIDYSQNELTSKSKIYWDPRDYFDENNFIYDEFTELFSNAVNSRMQADVPVATFLSGGLDSTSIVKKLSESGKKINTFSVHVDNPKYDESKWSDIVSKKYNTNHSTVKISSNISKTTINDALNSFDEPYSDPSVIPSFLISKEISKIYKVAISGDGGDELLGGYSRIHNTLRAKNLIDLGLSNFNSLYPAFFGTGNQFLSRSSNKINAYSSYFEDKNLMNILNLDYEKINLFDNEINPKKINYKDLLLAEYNFYLSEMMMLKVDRTSMSNSLEVRSPFVDHRLIEYIFSTSADYLEVGNPKNIIKKYLLTDFDNSFVNREKQGFVFDLENWIYSNLDEINSTFINGRLIYIINSNILNILTRRKSRMNALRIWKLYVLEQYLSRF